MNNENQEQYNLFFRVINRFFDFLGTLIAFLLFGVVLVQIFGRLMDIPASWTEEMTRYIFIWMIFIGIALGFRKVESPRVTFLMNRLPGFIKRTGIWIYSISTVLFFLFMVVYGMDLVNQQIQMQEKSSVLQIPMWTIGISLPLSAILGIVYLIQSLIYHRDLI